MLKYISKLGEYMIEFSICFRSVKSIFFFLTCLPSIPGGPLIPIGPGGP